MSFVEGQGVWGKIPFVDGVQPAYNRPYLVVGVNEDYIEVLNVSTTKGKERKIAFPSNQKLKSFQPPFYQPSFVKLDSLTRVPKSKWEELNLMSDGETLNAEEYSIIKSKMQRF